MKYVEGFFTFLNNTGLPLGAKGRLHFTCAWEMLYYMWVRWEDGQMDAQYYTRGKDFCSGTYHETAIDCHELQLNTMSEYLQNTTLLWFDHLKTTGRA